MSRGKLMEISKTPFTNSIEQVINPGDQVVAITTGYGHNVSVCTGIYEGKYPDGGLRIGNIPVDVTREVYCDETDPGARPELKYIGWDRVKGSSYKITGKFYKYVNETVLKRTKLYRNRAFKIDTPFIKIKS